jgi:hypothetical protein
LVGYKVIIHVILKVESKDREKEEGRREREF